VCPIVEAPYRYSIEIIPDKSLFRMKPVLNSVSIVLEIEPVELKDNESANWGHSDS
jgi:hypothetical protein